MSRIFLNYILLLCICLIALNYVQADELKLAWELDNFDAPESVLYDSQHNIVFLSNVVGVPNEKDGKGYISTLSLSGELINKYWITGLNAPKGLARFDNYLYVSDIDTLLKININNGRIEKRYFASEAKFLNDVVVDDNGLVYVSDMLDNSIYRLSGNNFAIWLQSDDLESPNGLHLENNQLIIGSWGHMTEGFSTDIPGHLKVVALDSRQISSLGDGTPVGNLDGVEVDGNGNFYVTDWLNGGLYLIKRSGEAEKLMDLPQGSADHDVILNMNLMLIPKMVENKLTAYKFK